MPEGHEPALRLVTRGAEKADPAEIAANPRAASVRLRAIERIRPGTEGSSVMSSTAPQLRSRLPRLAEAAVERARLTVVPRRRTRAPRVPFVTLVSLLLLGGVVGLLLFNTSMQQASFAATALEQQATNLSAREQTLQMELERLRDPQRIAEAAKRQGMVIAGRPGVPRPGHRQGHRQRGAGDSRERHPDHRAATGRGRPSSTRPRSGSRRAAARRRP